MVKQIPDFPPMRVLLTNTRVPKNTGELVAGVARRLKKYPAIVEPILNSIDAISNTCLDVLRASVGASKAAATASRDDVVGEGGSSGAGGAGAGASSTGASGDAVLERMGELICMNQHLLNALGVGHAALDTVVRVSEEHGFPAKLTGAGGGGCALTLLHGTGEGDDAQADLERRVAALSEELATHGYQCFETKVGGAGMLLHDIRSKTVREKVGL